MACTDTGLKICWRLHTLTLNPLKNKKCLSHIVNEEIKESYPRTILLYDVISKIIKYRDGSNKNLNCYFFYNAEVTET